MTKTPIKSIVEKILNLQSKGINITLLGIGPMSSNLLQASFELAQTDNFPLIFIASRNQVDIDELGGGYVNGWTQSSFKKEIEDISNKIGFNGLYYICRDHGGPWQRDNERNDCISLNTAMDLSKKSLLADIKAGFDLIMIDPTKDPFYNNKIIPLSIVLERTIELIDYCEKERKLLNIKEISYEVGTEETNGGLTSIANYESFISQLKFELENRNLPMPIFIVGQTGTLTKKTNQIGNFNFKKATELSTIAKKYGLALKEHNADFLENHILLEHGVSHVSAINIAPQYGVEETKAYLKLVEIEETLKSSGFIEETSKLREILLKKSIECGRWKKWLLDEEKQFSIKQISENKVLSKEIIYIAGHYNFNNDEVKLSINKLYNNLLKNNIDGEKFVINCIKHSLRMHVENCNLKNSTNLLI